MELGIEAMTTTFSANRPRAWPGGVPRQAASPGSTAYAFLFAVARSGALNVKPFRVNNRNASHRSRVYFSAVLGLLVAAMRVWAGAVNGE